MLKIRLREALVPLTKLNSQDFEEAREAFLNWAAGKPNNLIISHKGVEFGELGELVQNVSQNTVIGRGITLAILAECERTGASPAQVVLFFG